MTWDYAVVEDDDVLLLHHAECPVAREAAALGKPVMTLMGCAEPFEAFKADSMNLSVHQCLELGDVG